MRRGEHVKIHPLGLLRVLLLHESLPVRHEGQARRLQQVCLGHRQPVLPAHEELHQLPGLSRVPRSRVDAESVGRAEGDSPGRPGRDRRHSDAKVRVFEDALESPGAVLDHGELALGKRRLGSHVVDIREGRHDLVVPHPGPHPLKSRQGLGAVDVAFRCVRGIYDVAAPGIDMYLQPVPTDVDHAAPDVGRAVAVGVPSQPLHGREVVLMSPGGVRVGDLVLVEDVLVVVEDERALILRHPVLASAHCRRRPCTELGPSRPRLPCPDPSARTW